MTLSQNFEPPPPLPSSPPLFALWHLRPPFRILGYQNFKAHVISTAPRSSRIQMVVIIEISRGTWDCAYNNTNEKPGYELRG